MTLEARISIGPLAEKALPKASREVGENGGAWHLSSIPARFVISDQRRPDRPHRDQFRRINPDSIEHGTHRQEQFQWGGMVL
ncbi:hypothetical protein [Roseovarius aquimarinus]|uniref:Uncharacterized protein n=1 Tax=Roseovarius aquimarinus TaxID=1229156 RepID=A0ABW7I5T5_9RHOB